MNGSIIPWENNLLSENYLLQPQSSASVHLFLSSTWKTQDSCPLTLSPASHILQVLQICTYLYSGMGSHCSTCNLWRMHSSTAARILHKKGHSEAERAGHQNPTRGLENKEKEAEIILPILDAMTRLQYVGFFCTQGPLAKEAFTSCQNRQKRTQSCKQEYLGIKTKVQNKRHVNMTHKYTCMPLICNHLLIGSEHHDPLITYGKPKVCLNTFWIMQFS